MNGMVEPVAVELALKKVAMGEMSSNSAIAIMVVRGWHQMHEHKTEYVEVSIMNRRTGV